MEAMDNSDQLLHELEAHIQRVFEHHSPKQPHAQAGNEADKRGDLIKALTRFIDQRIDERLKELRSFDRCRPAI
jgi:hypothetical protein